jgi:hypothetical protein
MSTGHKAGIQRGSTKTCPRTRNLTGGADSFDEFTTLADAEDAGIFLIRFQVTDAAGRYGPSRSLRLSYVDYGQQGTLTRRMPLIPPQASVSTFERTFTWPWLVPSSTANSRRMQVQVEVSEGLAGEVWQLYISTARKNENGIWVAGGKD